MMQGYPYAVIGNEGIYPVGDKKVRGRKFKWGIAEGENFSFSLFSLILSDLKHFGSSTFQLTTLSTVTFFASEIS